MKRTSSDGQRGKKKKKSFKFTHAAKHSHLFSNPDEVSRGFLASCETHAIARGVQELCDLLNRFAVELYGPPPPPPTADSGVKKRFVVYDAGVAGMIAVKVQDPAIDPVSFANRMFARIAAIASTPGDSGLLPKTTSLVKVVPVQAFVSASVSAIREKAAPVVRAVLGGDETTTTPPRTFAVAYKGRNNEALTRDAAIDAMAGLADPRHRVDLDNPQVTLLCEVVKSAAAVSAFATADEWVRWHKWNLREVIKAATPTIATATVAPTDKPATS
jgi:tRNA(Ser,Leu) C12 N-acetylase TAN1